MINPSRRVLVVDDNEINRKLITLQLRKIAVDFDVLPDGGAAIAALAQRPDEYALVLLDCHMPNLTGFETARRLRGAGLRIPIVGFSASIDPVDRARAHEAGMDDFVSRPIALEGLKRVILALLSPLP